MSFIGGFVVNRRGGLSPVEFVSAAAASNPASTSDPGEVSSITIPRPSGVEDGDLLLAVVASLPSAGVDFTAPSGWTRILEDEQRAVYTKIASSEPASWTWSDMTVGSVTGCVAAFRNAELGDTALILPPPAATFPDVDAVAAGAMFVGLTAGQNSALTESYSATSPLTERAEHVAGGGAYVSAMSSMIATEDDLGAGTVSGHTWSNANVLSNASFSVILEPVS